MKYQMMGKLHRLKPGKGALVFEDIPWNEESSRYFCKIVKQVDHTFGTQLTL